jgi:DNA polymerase-3 subunit epsilon
VRTTRKSLEARSKTDSAPFEFGVGESHLVGRRDADRRNAYQWALLRIAAMYLPNFLDGFDRLVAFDAETTGKRTPDAEFIRKQPFAWRAPGIIIEVGFVELLRQGEGWRKSETWSSRVNPDGPIDPEAIKIHRIRPGDLKNAPRFPTILAKVKDFVGDSPIVAHAYKNERDFLDYEFARAKVIQWGDSAYAEERYLCTQVLFAQLFPGAIKSLTSMCDRLALDSSERDDRHGALLDADMTADALILMEHQLKHGETAAPRSWTST